ncbi:hypothetical protein [Elizabethkingia anophelis]|uniref:hypothetical protein n=1 Tax=Elizabethkingia anophelis TaxID=1117645 RepID=UPI0020B247F1|nr:hypothetical protein [Elizabethkingia anophelis]MCT4306162.1 hypothetical protein [Elizabethkingia anophelis]MDV3831797.1 hypothetical protein [Elizabethkingia anophelis]UTF95128.1 hypothetical protein J2N94_09965 [Elizabethkingia anophelis]
MEIKDELIKFNENSLPKNFVAMATKIENKEATHAGILIRYQSINYLHHFDGKPPRVVENFDENGWYIYKIVDFISNDEFEVASFLQYCRRVCAKSQIKYGFIADGSFYDEHGNFISRQGLPEFGSCVGFCVGTLKGAILDLDANDDYFHLEDWDDTDIDLTTNDILNQYTAYIYPDLDWVLYNSFKKRIKPIEYISSAFTDSYPIRKVDLNDIKPVIQEYINDKF